MKLATRLTALALAGACFVSSNTATAEPMPLSDKDRKNIETYLGTGVIGDPVEGNPIDDATKFFSFENGTWTYRFTSGDNKGKDQEQSFETLKPDASGATGRYTIGKDSIYTLLRQDNGDISITSEEDREQDVISHFEPPQLIYASSLKPGESRKAEIGVKVYDIGSPDKVAHEGSLDLTLTYVGAYKVTVPAGSYDAALLRWDYKGKVGPANVEDTQYRFMATGAGSVAMIEMKSISAMLVYHDNTKYGKVLVGEK